MQSEVFSGARTIFKISGKSVGYAVGTNGSTGINYTPLATLGHLEITEHVPVAYSVEMSANMARIAKASRLASYPNFPGLRADVEGNLDSPQIMPAFGVNGLSILQSGELTAIIYDIVTAKSLYTVSGVKCAQKSWESQAGGMVSENCSFVARIAAENDESDLSIGG